MTFIIYIAIVILIIIIIGITNGYINKYSKNKLIYCSNCETDRMSERWNCNKCKKNWCKSCIDYSSPKRKADWVLRDGLSDLCVYCRPKREMNLSKPICFNCNESTDKKTSQCRSCHRTYCKCCKYESLNATNDKCKLCSPIDKTWEIKTSAKAICFNCNYRDDKMYQCKKCRHIYCKRCNYQINNDLCWNCVIVI